MGMIFVLVLVGLMIAYLRGHLGTYSRPTRSTRRTR